MKKFVDGLLKRVKVFIVSKRRQGLFERSQKRHGYSLSLIDPRTLSEKIQWMKIFG